MTAARIGFTGPGGTQHVMGRLGPGLALALAAAAADAPAAVLTAAVSDPHGSARLARAILADDYRGSTVTLRAQVRAADVAGHAGLELRIRAASRSGPPAAKTTAGPPSGSPAPRTGPAMRSPPGYRATRASSRSASR